MKFMKWVTHYGIVIIFIVGLFWIASVETYKIFQPEVNKTISFEVVGVKKDVNATTLVQIHFECIKHCERYARNSYNQVQLCYEQCKSLGRHCNEVDGVD